MSWNIRLNILNHNCRLFYSLKLNSEAKNAVAIINVQSHQAKISHHNALVNLTDIISSPKKTTGGVTEELSLRTDRQTSNRYLNNQINKYHNIYKSFTSGALDLQINRLHHIKKKSSKTNKKNLPFLHITPVFLAFEQIFGCLRHLSTVKQCTRKIERKPTNSVTASACSLRHHLSLSEEKNRGDKKNIAHMVTIDSEQGVAISGF